MKIYQKLAIILSLGLSLMGCGGVGTKVDPASLPIAIDDTATVTVNGAAIGILVLDNDTPIGKLDVSSVEIITPPLHGIASVTNTGEINYKPDAHYHGSDTLEYTVKNLEGNFSNPATVTITVSRLPFKITVKTDNAGVSNNNEFTLPIVGSSSIPATSIDCGSAGATITNDYTCIYPSAGTYTIGITGDIPHISFFTDGNDVKDNLKLLSIDQWGTGQWGSMEFAFNNCSNMTLNATDTPDLSAVTNMGYMFAGATLFDDDISSWDVSNVTDMSALFFKASSFNQNIDNWNVTNVTNMHGMFNGSSSFNQNIGSWDVSNITDMSWMFNLASSFNQDIGGWNVSKVTDMEGMFNTNHSFNQNISSWNVGSVTNMSWMFRDASMFNQDIGGWDVSNVTDMSSMFSVDTVTVFNQDIGNWNVGSVTNMNRMFNKATSFDQNIGGWDVSKVYDMQLMFRDAKLSTTNYDSLLIGWDKLPTLQKAVIFDAGNSQYSKLAEAARLGLETSTIPEWIIADGGCTDCPIK